MSTLILKLEDPHPRPAHRFALWQLGFRPFYLLAGIFSALSVLLWSLQFSGWLGHAYLAGPLWHAHEMLFGYSLAVVVGFLYTAGRNWSGQPTPTGWPLALLALLWVAGRVLVLTPFGGAAALVNTAFPLAAAAGLAVPLIRAKNRRNYFFIGLLVAMGAAQLGLHLAQLGVITLPAWVGVRVALDLMLFIMVVMGGRVIPMFTNNGAPGARARRLEWLERAALGGVIALIAADLVGVGGAPLVVVLLLCTVAHAARLVLWQPWRTLRTPLVWVLHAAYAWIVLHLALRTLAEIGLIIPSVATHALTAGAIGGLTIGMMTRTTRGHTARPLLADRFDVASYACILAAALVRVAVPLMAPSDTVGAAMLAGWLWACGFALFTLRYAPMLLRPRLDGKPG